MNGEQEVATCQGLMRKQILEWEFSKETLCALKKPHIFVFFVNNFLIILHVYFAQFSGIQGKMFWGLGMLQRRQHCTEHIIVIIFLESCTDLKCNLYGFLYAVFIGYFELKIMTVI